MAVTPNYGWPIPVATDYVKDGWDAIADLGNAIDTTLGSFSAGALTLIAAADFTNVASIQVNDCFSTTYDNYRLHFNTYSSAGSNNNLLFQYVDGTTAYTTGNYQNSYWKLTYTGSTGSGNNQSGTSIPMAWTSSGSTLGEWTSISADIYKPMQAYSTNMTYHSTSQDGGVGYFQVGGCTVPVTNTFEGFKITGSTGNITGRYYVYGYQKAV